MAHTAPINLAIFNSNLGHKYPRIFNLGKLVAKDNNAGSLFENIITKYDGAKEILQTVGQALWEGEIKGFSGFCITGWSTLGQEKILD